ncbi:TonB-dependent receptor domain-containing protein [Hoylesella loescheii]|uniref:TonB-dependent receptor n=1 Tax=Hoylesella loescheii TaxID=840 RepID=UPI0028EF56E2|nr:TonB-dependent receptor [Hoylesella loescheii]
MRFITTLTAATLAVTLNAAPEDSATIGGTIDEVSVVGFKQDRASISPVSQQAMGERFIENNQLMGIRDLSGMIANFYMPDYGSRQYSPIYIRGIGSRVNSPSVGVYVDGIPYFDRTVLDMDLFGVSKVEVLRGPQGTLFGRNASAGLINVFTRSPLDYQGTSARVSYGSYNDLLVAASTYNKVSHNFGLSLAANYHHTDGFLTNTFLNNKADRMNNGTIRLGAAWKPTERWTSRFTATLDLTRQNGYPYAPYNPQTGILQPIAYNRESSYRRLVGTLGMSWRYDADGWSLNSQTAFQHNNGRIEVDQDYSPQDIFAVKMPHRQNQVSQEFTLRSTNDSRYQWIVGAFGFHQQDHFTVYTTRIASKLYEVNQNKLPTMGFALYHVSTFNIVKGLWASAGIRFDWEKNSLKNFSKKIKLTDPNEPPILKPLDPKDGWQITGFDANRIDRQITPKFTLKYQFTPFRMIYATVAKGYKAGGFNAVRETDADYTYKPEHTWNYELGAKWSFLKGLLAFEASAFYIDWQHQQLSVTVPALGNVVRNVGHSNSKGFELALNATPLPSLSLQASYGYTYAKMLEARMGVGKDYSGNMLPLVPRHTLSFNANYVVNNLGRIADKLMFNANLTGVGPLYWREDNAVKQSFYTLLNLKAALTRGIFTLEVWSRNTLATNYLTYYFVAPTPMAQKGKPFTIGTTLMVKW